MLEQAAQGQPADVEINEHLGDAYFAAGRRVEARFAWKAASVYAEGAAAARHRRQDGDGPDAATRRAADARKSRTPRSTWRCMSAAREPDGYHRIETIFAFCEDGDVLSARRPPRLSLAVTGPFAGDAGERADNLVLALARRGRSARTGALTLDKRLPVAAGLGGGSADAAAALRLLGAAGCGRDDARAAAGRRRAGLPAQPHRARRRQGRRDRAASNPGLAGTPVLLVNPGVPLPTPRCSAAGTASTGARSATGKGRQRPRGAGPTLAPEIGEVLDALAGARARAHVRLGRDLLRPVRQTRPRATPRRRAIAAAHPGWWLLPNQSPLTHRSRSGTGLAAVNHRDPQESVVARLLRLCRRRVEARL